MDTKNILKTPSTPKKADRCFVGKGVFVTRDVSIPVNAISAIQVFEPPLVPFASAILFGVLGFFLLFVKSETVKAIGA